MQNQTEQPLLDFDGCTYVRDKDCGRLNRQFQSVLNLMRDGLWRSLAEIEQETGFPQASVSARLRDLRKPRFGGHQVDRRRRTQGCFEYSLKVTP